ncbi:hypothetical protein GBS0709_17320 [Edwardsiella tarda]|nr:hypothetical protein GBS0709_17320 [Edwardsiella tarda]
MRMRRTSAGGERMARGISSNGHSTERESHPTFTDLTEALAGRAVATKIRRRVGLLN